MEGAAEMVSLSEDFERNVCTIFVYYLAARVPNRRKGLLTHLVVFPHRREQSNTHRDLRQQLIVGHFITCQGTTSS